VTLNDVYADDVAVFCRTNEEVREFIALVRDNSPDDYVEVWDANSDDRYLDFVPDSPTCIIVTRNYRVDHRPHLGYSARSYFEKQGYTIVNFAELTASERDFKTESFETLFDFGGTHNDV